MKVKDVMHKALNGFLPTRRSPTWRRRCGNMTLGRFRLAKTIDLSA